MSKLRKSMLLLSLSAMAVCGLAAVSSNKSNEVNATPHTQNFDLYDYQNYSGTYYDFLGTKTYTDGLDGSLREALSANILPKAWYSYSGGGETHLSAILQEADEDPTNSDNMIYLYTRDSVKKNAASTWNREHVWPQSLSGGCWGTGSGGGSDLLHIRPTYNKTNSTRGNLLYGQFSGGTACTYEDMPYGYKSGNYFMPLDSVKGDIARDLMYVWVAYKNKYANLPNLTNTIDSYNTLLKWHTEDKPDIMEEHRNNVSESSLQKNRNPFVDHPEYAWKIFGDSCSSTVKNACIEAYPDIEQKKLINLSYTGVPNQTTYYVHEQFNPEGLTVIATYDDESTKNVTNEVTWSSFELDKNFVTGSYGGKTITITGLTILEPSGNVEGVSLDKKTATIKVNGTLQLTPTITPSYAKNKNVSWFSSSSSVATVDSNGLVTGVSEGTATITVRTEDGNFTATCIVTVSGSQDDVYNVEITRNSFTSKGGYAWYDWSQNDVSGKAFMYTTNVSSMQFNGGNAGKALFSDTTKGTIKSITVKAQTTEKSPRWTLYTSNTPYSQTTTTSGTSQGQKSVTSSGVKWELSNSDKYFSLSLNESGAAYLSSIIVEYDSGVVPPTPTPKVNSIDLPSNLNIEKTTSNTGTITPIVDADEGAEYEISWSSSDESVATVLGDNSSATVTALKAGTTTITASIGDLSDTCVVTVTENIVPPTPVVHSIELPDSLSIDINESYTGTLVPTVSADDGASYLISWSSSDTSVATVSGTNSSAIVTAKKEGATIITARIGDLSDTCVVTVTNSYVPPTPVVHSITLQETLSIDLKTISSKTITPMVDADEGATYTISWSSSNTSVATVSGNNSSATIVALKEGTSTITASIGDKSATCLVTVTNSYVPPTPVVRSISIQQTMSIDLDKVTSKQIVPFIDADPDALFSINWSSSDTSVVTVNGNNLSATVTALKEGTATITASIGALSDTCVVTVTKSIVPPIIPIVRSIVLPNTLSIDLATEDHKTITPIVDADEGAEYDIHWSSSDTSIVSISGNNNSATLVAHKEGTVSIMASFGGLYDTCVVTVTRGVVPPTPVKELVEWVVTKYPDKSLYHVGDVFDPTGIEAEAHYLDGSSEDITDQIIVGSADLSSAGTKQVKVTYKQTSKFIKIEVTDLEITALNIVENPAKLNYYASESFSKIGLVVEAVFSNNEIKDVTNLVSIEYDFANSNLVKVSFGGITKVIKVTIEEGEITDTHIAVDYTYIFQEEVKGLLSKDVTLEIWKVLEHYYNSLDEDAQKVLRETVVNLEGSVDAASGDSEKLIECLEKYDEIYLKNKDKGFNDFMERDPKSPNPVNPNKDKDGVNLPLIIGIIAGILVLTIVIIIIAVSAHKKGKRKHA